MFTSFTSHVSDGVLRLLISKTGIDPQRPSCIAFFGKSYKWRGPHMFASGTNPQDPKLIGPVLEPHPVVLEGSRMAYESKKLGNGKLYVRVDMPGVPKENFIVSVTNGRVNVTGKAPGLSHNSGGRLYSGDVAMFSTPIDIPTRRIKPLPRTVWFVSLSLRFDDVISCYCLLISE
ncbi:hypothetical protein AALP_AA5G020600 [Arabis alpina]|uniref:SHSP domain-containing protein n=1 Tax=Arabis alpina TaxID=50452 RepID=A0A087GUE4_ARAAL|nr:hypothetical protein AALP_AA5G020600 [Arabis alpina]